MVALEDALDVPLDDIVDVVVDPGLLLLLRHRGVHHRAIPWGLLHGLGGWAGLLGILLSLLRVDRGLLGLLHDDVLLLDRPDVGLLDLDLLVDDL